MLLNEAQRKTNSDTTAQTKEQASYSSGFGGFFIGSHHAFVVTKGFDFVKIMFWSSYQRIIRRRMDQSDYGNLNCN
jgi:hypothetical protein